MLSQHLFATLSALLPFALPLAAIGCGPETHGAREGASPQSTDERKAMARRYFEDMWNRMDASVADEIVDRDVVGHVGASTLHHLDALKDRVASIDRVYEASAFSIETVVAEGEFVAVRWVQRARHSGSFLGPHTKGKAVVVGGMSLFRFSGGKIAEIWVSADDLGELQQLGIEVPSGV